MATLIILGGVLVVLLIAVATVLTVLVATRERARPVHVPLLGRFVGRATDGDERPASEDG